MPSQSAFTITYSHGGGNAPGWVAVPGTTTGAGRPIEITGAIIQPALKMSFTGTSVTFVVEGNSGALDNTGNPPSGDWHDYTEGTPFSLTTGQNLAYLLPLQEAYWRTRITAITLGAGAGFVSYVGPIVITGGSGPIWTSASYITLATQPNFFGY